MTRRNRGLYYCKALSVLKASNRHLLLILHLPIYLDLAIQDKELQRYHAYSITERYQENFKGGSDRSLLTVSTLGTSRR